jgi:hypothetical protein
MSVTTKKELNALKDSANKQLAYWRSQPISEEQQDEITATKRLIAALDTCPPNIHPSKIEKKVLNEVKDSLHFELEGYKSWPDSDIKNQVIFKVLQQLAGLELSYPQYKFGYKTPKQRKDENINCVLLVPVALFLMWMGTPHTPNTTSQQQQQTVDVAQ